MKSKKITVLFKQPLNEARLVTIDDNLDSYEELIGGVISTIGLEFPNQCPFSEFRVVFDDVGLSKGLMPNINYYNGSIVGNVIITKMDKYIPGEFASLDERDIEYLQLNYGAWF